MAKFIELTNADSKRPIFVNVETISALTIVGDENGQTVVYIAGNPAPNRFWIDESYEEVKAKIKRSGVISCSEIVKRRNNQ